MSARAPGGVWVGGSVRACGRLAALAPGQQGKLQGQQWPAGSRPRASHCPTPAHTGDVRGAGAGDPQIGVHARGDGGCAGPVNL